MDAVRADPPSHPPAGVAALAGARHVATLRDHLHRLRGACDHGNRRLFYDELVTAHLLAFFNPTLRSLRAIADAGRFDAEGHPTHLRKLCRSTMSDAAALFDARLLVPIVRHLRARVPDLRRRDGQLGRLLDHVQLVDGSFFASAADVAWALRDPRRVRQGPAGPAARRVDPAARAPVGRRPGRERTATRRRGDRARDDPRERPRVRALRATCARSSTAAPTSSCASRRR